MHQFNQRFKIQRQSFKVFDMHLIHVLLYIAYMTFYLTFSTLLLKLHEDEVPLYFLWNKLNHALSLFCIKVSITYNLVWRRPR